MSLSKPGLNKNNVSFAADRGGGLYGWQRVRDAVPRIRQYGREIGVLTAPPEPQISQSGYDKDDVERAREEAERLEKEAHDKREEGVNIPVKDTSRIHQAIPFLPFPVALVLLFLNICLPGIGTILSGFMVLCMGYPRLQVKEMARFLSSFINLIVGFCQLITVPILLMGWFWSIAWGAMIMVHSLQYREAMFAKRQAQVATAALEALTNDTLLRRREVHTLIKSERDTGGGGSKKKKSDKNRKVQDSSLNTTM